MKGVKAPLGYTIVEVMIVLAVSGVMFLIAANFINGKQERTSFSQGVNEMASRVQDMITQVVNGRYSDIPLVCFPNGSGTGLSFINPGVTSPIVSDQGTNPDCTFLGKVLHVQAANSPDYEVFTVAGGRLDPITNLPVTSIANSQPTAAAPPYGPGNPIDLTDHEVTPQNLYVKHIIVNGNPFVEIGFLQSPGTSNGAGGLQNGPQSVNLYTVSGGTPGMSETIAAQIITGANLTLVRSASICMTDNRLYAQVLIGTNNDALNVSVKMDNTVPC